jgi:DNA-binding NarL/FixJ family response regulator
VSATPDQPIRVLVFAAQPFSLDDLGPEVEDRFVARLIRRPDDLEATLDRFRPGVVLVDTALADRAGLAAIDQILVHAPGIRVIALTPKPPPEDQVVLAARAGAVGFIDVDEESETYAEAIDAVSRGEKWFPADATRRVLAAVADDLDTSPTERRSRLTGMVIALVPVTALIAAIQTGLWRRYMGQIGVRPVDLAVDPASRVIDAIVAMLFAMGVIGPLLLIGSWLDLLEESPLNRGPIAWLLERRKLAHVLASLLWLAIAAVLAIGPETGLVVIVGPLVFIAFLARILDASDALPRALRITGVRTRGLIAASLATAFLFVGGVGYETLVVGPDLRTDGVHGILAPKVLGIRAQPVRAVNVNTDEAHDLLYLGGNADLYVLVDPCDEDRVDYVSVGAHRLTVIDVITCPDDS